MPQQRRERRHGQRVNNGVRDGMDAASAGPLFTRLLSIMTSPE